MIRAKSKVRRSFVDVLVWSIGFNWSPCSTARLAFLENDRQFLYAKYLPEDGRRKREWYHLAPTAGPLLGCFMMLCAIQMCGAGVHACSGSPDPPLFPQYVTFWFAIVPVVHGPVGTSARRLPCRVTQARGSARLRHLAPLSHSHTSRVCWYNALINAPLNAPAPTPPELTLSALTSKRGRP